MIAFRLPANDQVIISIEQEETILTTSPYLLDMFGLKVIILHQVSIAHLLARFDIHSLRIDCAQIGTNFVFEKKSFHELNFFAFSRLFINGLPDKSDYSRDQSVYFLLFFIFIFGSFPCFDILFNHFQQQSESLIEGRVVAVIWPPSRYIESHFFTDCCLTLPFDLHLTKTLFHLFFLFLFPHFCVILLNVKASTYMITTFIMIPHSFLYHKNRCALFFYLLDPPATYLTDLFALLVGGKQLSPCLRPSDLCILIQPKYE